MKITFITSDGKTIEAEAEAGENLLAIGQGAGMPLEGTCEGQMACSTCHVILDKEWFVKMPQASEDEEDMLDLAASVEATSRLSCQIDVTEEMDGMSVRIPDESHNAQGF